MTDPEHPLCQISEAIKEALPGFEQADLWGEDKDSDVTVQRLVNSFSDQAPRYAGDVLLGAESGLPRTFMYHTRTVFFQDDQGMWLTMRGLAQLDQLPQDLWQRAGLSDVFVLQWDAVDSLDLPTLEKILRDLIDTVVPEVDFLIQPYDSPQCRSGLRMQFEGSTLPAALGGVLARDNGADDGPQRGSMMLCLEAWAGALSGKTIDLEDAKPYKDAMLVGRKEPS